MALTRTRIKQLAKDAVLFHGAYTVLEFGDEVIRRYLPDEAPERTQENLAAITAEAVVQANRVLQFMGR